MMVAAEKKNQLFANESGNNKTDEKKEMPIKKIMFLADVFVMLALYSGKVKMFSKFKSNN